MMETREYKISDSTSGYLDFPVVMTEPRTLQQDGTVAQNNCTISGDYNICPAGADFNFSGAIKRLTAQLKCPLSAVAQSDFREATQKGLCECDATVLDVPADGVAVDGVEPVPLDCECFICPDQANLFGVAYTCTSPIYGPCVTFNCEGTCNGELTFIDSTTRAPTQAPAAASSSAGYGASTSPVVATAVLLLLTILRMVR